jgi:hypothetical protein
MIMGLRDHAFKVLAKGIEAGGKAAEKAASAKEKASVAKDVATGGAKIVGGVVSEKAKEISKENAKKPSTGSGILDLIVPAVPHTEHTKPKAEKLNKGGPKP